MNRQEETTKETKDTKTTDAKKTHLDQGCSYSGGDPKPVNLSLISSIFFRNTNRPFLCAQRRFSKWERKEGTTDNTDQRNGTTERTTNEPNDSNDQFRSIRSLFESFALFVVLFLVAVEGRAGSFASFVVSSLEPSSRQAARDLSL